MSRVRIGRLNLETRVPYQQAVSSGPTSDPSPAFTGDLAAALGDMLAPICDAGDPSVWIISRLDFDLAGGPNWESRRTADALAEEMRRTLLRVFSGEASDLAIRFPDRPTYLAQFLCDLVDGTARDRWYFSAFRRFDAIPTGIAACMVLEAEPDHAFSVLVALNARGRLPQFLMRLSEGEALRILRLLGDRAGTEPPENAMISVCEFLLKQATPMSLPVLAKDQLKLLVSIGTVINLPPDVLLSAMNAVLARVQKTLRTNGPTARLDLPAKDVMPDSLKPEDGASELRRLINLLAHSSYPDRKQARSVRAAVDDILTPRAGVFLLWRSIIDMQLDEVLTGGCEAVEAKARRHCLAVALSGPAQADAADDEALRWLTRHEEPEVGKAGTFASGEAALLQQALFRTLTGLRPVRPIRLAMVQESGVTILQDLITQDWYFVRGEGGLPSLPDCDITSILVPATIAAELCDQLPGWASSPLPDERHILFTRGVDPDEGVLSQTARAVEELRPVAPDLAYLSGADGFSEMGLTMMLFARAAYADLGRRLPGLMGSSASYLGRNAIHGIGRLRANLPANVDVDAEVDLPSMPFDFIWRMTGMDGTVFRLADGRSIRLNMARAAQ
ncbi:hypothetical protein JNB88_13360 [Rhizobium cauense]|uniref:hypothetical protein n=1 Tax=Rhizobium cauense TaxID=1166683 RepID=UPI001C6DEA6A|nr:hypothetical protein [Rhizobium cauense]MBW9114634.1 hypothetical protein [Rhizobium cauense]